MEHESDHKGQHRVLQQQQRTSYDGIHPLVGAGGCRRWHRSPKVHTVDAAALPYDMIAIECLLCCPQYIYCAQVCTNISDPDTSIRTVDGAIYTLHRVSCNHMSRRTSPSL